MGISQTDSLTLIKGFAPVSDRHSRTLVLGSMPGVESLRVGQYYSNPRNAFWLIMGELVGAGTHLAYESRLTMLKARGIALWDVLGSCIRSGSLDTAIEPSSIQVNDFATFFKTHPNITRVFFNGSYADSTYRKYVPKILKTAQSGLATYRLPSTSPAHASRRYDEKLLAWRAIIAE